MKKFVVIIWTIKPSEDISVHEYNTQEQAMEAAEMFWNHLTDKEKENIQEFSVVEGEFPKDEEIDFYGITKVIKSYK